MLMAGVGDHVGALHPFEIVTSMLMKLVRTYRRRMNVYKAICKPDACSCVTLPQMRLEPAGCIMYEEI